MWLTDMKKRAVVTLCVCFFAPSGRPVSLLLSVPSCLTRLLPSGSRFFSMSRSASRCQSSHVYFKETRLHIVVYGTCTEINFLY